MVSGSELGLLEANWRERTSLTTPGPGVVSQGGPELAEEQCPTGLVGVQSLSRLDVREVFTVGPHHEWLLCSLKPVPPLPQSKFDGKELLVADIVVLLIGG